MKQFLSTILIFVFISSQVNGQYKAKFDKRAYKSFSLNDSLLSNYKKIAILPFQCNLPLSYLKQFNSPPQFIEVNTAFEMQQKLYTELMKRKDKPTILIQTVEESNQLLQVSNITSSTILNYTKEEICKVLKVDALIVGKVKLDDIGSIKENIANMAATQVIGFGRGIRPTLSSTFLVQIIDGENEEVCWECRDSQALMPAVSIEDLKKFWVKIVSENFPY